MNRSPDVFVYLNNVHSAVQPNCNFLTCIQSGASSLAKHGGAYFSAVNEFMKDPIDAPGVYENQEV